MASADPPFKCSETICDLIDLYVEYATKACDAPKIYHVACGYWVISAVLGRYVKVITAYRREGIAPNLWVLLIGPSRIVRKTTAMNLAVRVVKEVAPQVILKASFTPESLYEVCNQLNPGDCIAWVKDEMGGFFKSLEKKYMYGVREILSSMYTGEGEERVLRNLRLRIPEGLYVTAIGTLPWPSHHYISEEDFETGFLNRWVLVFAEKREKTYPLLHQSPEAESLRRDLIEKLRELNQALGKRLAVISPTYEALEKLDDYQQELDRRITVLMKTAPTSLLSRYLGEADKFLMKLSILRRLARGGFDDPMTVEAEDVTKALNDLNLFLESAEKVIAEVEASPRPRPALTDERILAGIYNFIESKGEEGATLSELLRHTKLRSKDLKEYIFTLMEQESMICVKVPSGGRPVLKFFASRFANIAIPKGEPIRPETLRVLLR
jgi:hypothetical protein